jgi:hypothetical protein
LGPNRHGGPGEIRTHGLQLRRLAPYEPHNTRIVHSTGLGNGPCTQRRCSKDIKLSDWRTKKKWLPEIQKRTPGFVGVCETSPDRVLRHFEKSIHTHELDM